MSIPEAQIWLVSGPENARKRFIVRQLAKCAGRYVEAIPSVNETSLQIGELLAVDPCPAANLDDGQMRFLMAARQYGVTLFVGLEAGAPVNRMLEVMADGEIRTRLWLRLFVTAVWQSRGVTIYRQLA